MILPLITEFEFISFNIVFVQLRKMDLLKRKKYGLKYQNLKTRVLIDGFE